VCHSDGDTVQDSQELFCCVVCGAQVFAKHSVLAQFENQKVRRTRRHNAKHANHIGVIKLPRHRRLFQEGGLGHKRGFVVRLFEHHLDGNLCLDSHSAHHCAEVAGKHLAVLTRAKCVTEGKVTAVELKWYCEHCLSVEHCRGHRLSVVRTADTPCVSKLCNDLMIQRMAVV
jgi:hypothetical protein